MSFSDIPQRVTVQVDRPMGTFHPKYPDIYYPVNYGFIPGIMAGDGEEQDAYILGLREPVTEFTGRVAAVIHRKNDCEDKWVVTPEGTDLPPEEILAQVSFQEQYFLVEIYMIPYE